MSGLTGGRGPRPVFAKNEEHRANRPAMVPRVRGNILFHDTGPTGEGRIRRLGDYKGNKSEKNFEHLHHKFTEEEA